MSQKQDGLYPAGQYESDIWWLTNNIKQMNISHLLAINFWEMQLHNTLLNSEFQGRICY